jgi:ribosomal subunit interface protein
MKIQYFFKKIENSEPYKIYFEGKLKRIKKFFPKKEEVILHIEFSHPTKRKNFYVEFNLGLNHKKNIRATFESSNPFEAIDKAIDKLVAQLKKLKIEPNK